MGEEKQETKNEPKGKKKNKRNRNVEKTWHDMKEMSKTQSAT